MPRNRQELAAFQCWHPDGAPYSDADYEKAGLPVPTQEQLAHWAFTERWIADLKAEFEDRWESSIRTWIET